MILVDTKLFLRLKEWRDGVASRRGCEPYMVLSNATLSLLAERKPITKEDFFSIPGIKEARWRQYGAALLLMIGDSLGAIPERGEASPLHLHEVSADALSKSDESGASRLREGETGVSAPSSVGAFLDMLNESFAGMRVALKGEVSGVEERRGVTYFVLKDTEGEGMLACVLFARDDLLQSVRLEDGQEVIVEGSPNVWKPRGKLSFRVSVVRLSGAGALKRAYDALLVRLEDEGVFAEVRKRPMPTLPSRIALLTSREGAAIGDFMMNLGRHGFAISLFDAHVEGKRAIAELVAGIRHFNKHPERFDALVIIRGGGSLESLEAYNSESLVRAIVASKIPVLAGIGHEKDVSLSALAADRMVSTPTAAARALGESWEAAREQVAALGRRIEELFRDELLRTEQYLRLRRDAFHGIVRDMLLRFQNTQAQASRTLLVWSQWIARVKEDRARFRQSLSRVSETLVPAALLRIDRLEALLEAGNPRALLARGYTILRKHGRVVRCASDVAKGDEIEALVSDGRVRAEVLGSSEEGL